MKTSIVLSLFLFLLTSCNPLQKPEDKATSALGGGGGTNVGAAPVDEPMAPRLVRVMNYNQYNMTLAKLTGINQSKVSSIFEQIKGSLPADGDISAMTSFNLVAKTRLADFYCGIYINGERDAAGALVAGGIPMLPDSLVSVDASIKNHLLTKFLDYDPADPNPIFDSLTRELDFVLSNSDGQGGVLIGATNLSAVQLNRNLSVMACVTVLASSHITLLE